MEKYIIEANGYGGEFTMGEVSLVFLEKWRHEQISLGDVEDWYDTDDLEHITSCYENTEFVVKDGSGDVVYKGSLDWSNSRDINTGTNVSTEGCIPIMQCFAAEEGHFFNAEFETDNFDLKKLAVKYVETDFGNFIEHVSYDGKHLDIDDSNCDTRKTGFEARVGWVNLEWHEKEYSE